MPARPSDRNNVPSVENDSSVAFSVYVGDTNITVRSGSIRLAVNNLSSAITSLEPWLKMED
jgi:hypothetical protein